MASSVEGARNDLDLGSRRQQDEVIRIHHAHVLAVLAREVEMSVKESLLLTPNFTSALKAGADAGAGAQTAGQTLVIVRRRTRSACPVGGETAVPNLNRATIRIVGGAKTAGQTLATGRRRTRCACPGGGAIINIFISEVAGYTSLIGPHAALPSRYP